MKKQNKQSLIKKIILSTIVISGLFLVIFNINFSFLQNNNIVFINVCVATPEVKGGTKIPSTQQQTDVSSESGGTKLNNLGELVVYGLLKTIAILISGLVNLINFSLSQEFVNTLFNSKAIYTGWKMVRDTLNIMFIFFLLFSAFSTIFQVSKYHIKSTWVMIVVMALLVNFSWPITRVIIDFSNVTMDYILGSPGTGTSTGEVASSGLMGELSNNAKFFEMMIGKTHFVSGTNNKVNLDSKGVLSAMMIGIVIGAIFLFTIGAIAILLLIRVILMAVLLVFASAGFVFAAFPSTRSVSSKWWKALLDQAILGPVVLFSLMLAVGVMGEVNDNVSQTHTMITGQLKALPQYAVSIILIWTGILAAKSISGQTAGMALSGATKIKGAAWKSTKFGAGVGDAWMAGGVNRMIKSDNKFVGGLGRGAARLRAMPDRARNIYQSKQKANKDALELAKAHGLNDGKAGGDKSAIIKHENKQVAEMKNKWKDENIDAKTLASQYSGANSTKARAITEALADMKEGVDENVVKKMVAASYDKKLNLSKDTIKSVGKKAAETGNAHILAKELNRKLRSEGMSHSQAETEVYKQVYNNMNAETLAKNHKSITRAAALPGSVLHQGISEKLDRTGFARDFQRYASNNATYRRAKRINGKYL